MQRTVTSIKFTYADVELKEDGETNVTLKVITVFNETDEEKALKKAVKKIGMFKPVKTEKFNQLYFLDDEIFFKYATVKGTEDSGE